MFGSYLVVLGLVLVYLTFIVWPPDFEYARGLTDSSSTTLKDFPSEVVVLNAIHLSMTYDERIVLMVIITGALGSYIHAATSFADYIGNRRLVNSWLLWYIIRPFVGAPTAFIFYLIVRAGFFTASATAADINRFGIGAVAGLAGMFSLKAADKMKEVFDTLFKTDDKRKDALENPAPTIRAITPNRVKQGEPANILLDGEGFIRASTVELDGLVCTSEYKSAQQLSLTIAADQFQKPGSVKVVVKNPQPGGGASSPADLTVDPR